MCFEEMDKHCGFRCTRQTSKPNENYALMNKRLAKCQLAEVFVLRDQQRRFRIGSIQYQVIRNTRIHFCHGEHLMSRLTQSCHDG